MDFRFNSRVCVARHKQWGYFPSDYTKSSICRVTARGVIRMGNKYGINAGGRSSPRCVAGR